jgi:hypothetical protein
MTPTSARPARCSLPDPMTTASGEDGPVSAAASLKEAKPDGAGVAAARKGCARSVPCYQAMYVRRLRRANTFISTQYRSE